MPITRRSNNFYSIKCFPNTEWSLFRIFDHLWKFINLIPCWLTIFSLFRGHIQDADISHTDPNSSFICGCHMRPPLYNSKKRYVWTSTCIIIVIVIVGLILIVIVNSRFPQHPKKRSSRDQLINRRLSRTKSMGGESDPESHPSRESDGCDGWCLEFRRGGR